MPTSLPLDPLGGDKPKEMPPYWLMTSGSLVGLLLACLQMMEARQCTSVFFIGQTGPAQLNSSSSPAAPNHYVGEGEGGEEGQGTEVTSASPGNRDTVGVGKLPGMNSAWNN